MPDFQKSYTCSMCDFRRFCRSEYPHADPERIFLCKGADSCDNWTNCRHTDSSGIIDIGADLESLKNQYLCFGKQNWRNSSDIIYKPNKPISTYLLHLLISPRLTVLLEAKIDDTLELIWLRPDLDNIWGYNSQNGFTTTSYEKYAQEGLSVFGSKQQQSILARVLVEPFFKDLKQYNLIEAWVALSQHMVKLNLPYRAMELAV